MSDRVIRLGGSHIGDPTSIYNLNLYLNKTDERKFVIVSAIPEVLELVNSSIENIFQLEINEVELRSKLHSFYTKRVNGELSETFVNLTNQLVSLLKGIALIGDYSLALKDQVLSFNEKLSVEILFSQWSLFNEKVQIIQPEDIGLETNTEYGNATFLSLSKNLISEFGKGTFLVPGSFGNAENGKIARTGFSSADYTAAFLTKELNAKKLELWDLDKDFQRADASIVLNPPVIHRLTYAEASELAYFDHYSLHPRVVEPLEHEYIPIVVISSVTSDGTIETTINTETLVEDQIVKSVACTDDISLLKLDGPGVGLKPGILAKVTTQLNDAGINIKSVITSQTSINFILDQQSGDRANALIHRLGFSSVTEISVVKNISLIGVVGHGMQHAYGVSAKIFTAVANNKINVLLSGSGASDLVSYLIVNKSDKEKSVREIYSAFFN